jgi:hypothetical protein
MYVDQPAVKLSANQLVESGRYRLGERAVMKKSYIMGNYDRAKALLSRSSHQDAIAGKKLRAPRTPYKDGSVLILHKQQVFIGARIDNRGLERNRERVAGLGIGQRVNGAQSCQRAGRRPGRRGPS